jgi:hypothetical protein
LRTLGRRWSDLIEAGLGCSQEVADRLVNAVVVNNQMATWTGRGTPQQFCPE